MPESLFSQAIRLIEEALIDVILSKDLEDNKKMSLIKLLTHARSIQNEVAHLMDKVYPEVECTQPARKASEGGCDSCINREYCESTALKRLNIEGTITRAIDLPSEPPRRKRGGL